jgi:hypothetical protein
MDPNKLLETMRDAAANVASGDDIDEGDMGNLLVSMQALDALLSSGGPWPDDWADEPVKRWQVVRRWDVHAVSADDAINAAVAGEHFEVVVERLARNYPSRVRPEPLPHNGSEATSS